ncbi:MAG: anhydro-N-acetylmuramic acid kinase [Rhodanobacteraceae bacterium]|nr:anhydro-N-acetylmuramic acid kinase [Rhodanobacteraceae bacterium]
MSGLFLGLISGTSADGIDAALVRFEPGLQVLSTLTHAYPEELRARLLSLTSADARISLDELGALDVAVGEQFAAAALRLIGSSPEPIVAIGSHGQTVRHRPNGPHPFSMQIGDPAVIAERTGITTVADFRRADVAAGGQGAPLAPALHARLFDAQRPCAVLNLGGIANLTLLSTDASMAGFDTGPANCLLDAWNARHNGSACDQDGAWARSGTVDDALLTALLGDPYFRMPAPKSSGREYFNLDWLDAQLGQRNVRAVDVQASLLALTARSIADCLNSQPVRIEHVFVCGGGVHNRALMDALALALAPRSVQSVAAVGVDPDYVEAILFAWLARERIAERPVDLARVTGAAGARMLGAVHLPPSF